MGGVPLFGPLLLAAALARRDRARLVAHRRRALPAIALQDVQKSQRLLRRFVVIHTQKFEYVYIVRDFFVLFLEIGAVVVVRMPDIFL